MAKGYRRIDRDRPLLLPPDMREWIRDDPVWLVIEIIEQHLDTSAFRAGRRSVERAVRAMTRMCC